LTVTAIAGGSLIQFRFLGGVVGLGIVSNVFYMRLNASLARVLNNQQLLALNRDTSVLGTLAPDVRDRVLAVFANEYNRQNYILIAFAAAQLLSAGMVWNKKWSKLG
jgi:hypothetical protein